ncbi:MAG TPA: hypothetical protein VJA86_01445 [Candidatus Nanoarchaeia archaeon]|nr:hypothetical protein [Candidatus Nanoarchaeia archaeon]
MTSESPTGILRKEHEIVLKLLDRLEKCLETSKMLFVYPVCFNSQKTKAFLIVLKNSNTLCGFSPEFLTKVI